MKKAIIAIVVLAVAVAVVVTLCLMPNFTYNDPDTVGNTAGNLYNGGVFCEYDNKVYFANPYDNNKLYVMDMNGQNAKKICDDRVSYINVAGDYIYYKRDNVKQSVDEIFNGVSQGVFRIKIGDEIMSELHRGTVANISLIGNYLYFTGIDKGVSSVHKSKIDDTEDKKLMEKSYKLISSYKGYYYFAETDSNHNILRMNIDTQVLTTYLEGNYYMPIASNEYLYFIDVGNGYKLCRASMSNRSIEVLSEERVINYNVGNNVIFYQVENGDDHRLMKMTIDGSNEEKIAGGDFYNISITSLYTYYYMDSIEGELIFRVLTNGKDEPEIYQP